MSRTLIIVPCYNEEQRLKPDIFDDFTARNEGIDFLFINDGSRDRTMGILEGWSAGSPGRYQVLDLPRNCGKAEAVRKGICAALDQDIGFVGFWDADLATPLEIIPDFLRIMENNTDIEIVMGSRVNLLGRDIRRGSTRHYLGRVFATVVSLLFKLQVYDTQCGAKIFRKSQRVAGLFETPFISRWIFDVELLVRYQHALKPVDPKTLDGHVYEFPLPRWVDVEGSKISGRDGLQAFVDLIRIYRARGD
jgi:dolichyl-phosphate beta-glucosyltransferase